MLVMLVSGGPMLLCIYGIQTYNCKHAYHGRKKGNY